MRLIIGLGNPGPSYARQRHNAGFIWLDEVAHRLNASPWKSKFQGELAEINVAGAKGLLFKPMTYMNRSGDPVLAACQFYKVAPEDCLVAHDELDIGAGDIKIKRGGGHAGHNGLRDLDRVMGPNYWRLRIGIGHPGHRERVTGHVLSDFTPSERYALDPILAALADTASDFLASGGAVWKEKASAILQPLLTKA